MFGADASFGGLKTYYTTHGGVKVFDYSYAKENGYIPEDYRVWWGYEDDKLYELAKEEITRLYETGKPFNFTMETADTHMPNGYLSENAETPYDNQYANVITYSTSQASEFIKWIMAQPFYENTTIVIIGDLSAWKQISLSIMALQRIISELSITA
ncbi:MAG: sulfatase-like hydrolase/transferase [Eubacterium sp.]|nr:sulfatase-like hydrolase/transferase [Eubacterium sp.]